MKRLWLVGLMAVFLLVSCTGAKKEVKKFSKSYAVVSCPADVEWDVAPSAKVEKFACYVGNFKGKKMLIYEITVKNVSNTPKRFRVNIINPTGKSVGGLIPRKGKPPVLKPGEAKSFKYPVPAYTEVPKKLIVSIRELK